MEHPKLPRLNTPALAERKLDQDIGNHEALQCCGVPGVESDPVVATDLEAASLLSRVVRPFGDGGQRLRDTRS